MREFNAVDLKKYLECNEPLLLDVRQPWEFNICHIDDSILIPMGQIYSYLDELDKDRETVVICHHGIRSRQVARNLEQADFSKVINLKGGVNAWAKTVDTTMARY